jgi:hypothetical protein
VFAFSYIRLLLISIRKTYIKKFIEKDISHISHILLDKQKRNSFYIFFNKSSYNLIRNLYQNFNIQNKQKQNLSILKRIKYFICRILILFFVTEFQNRIYRRILFIICRIVVLLFRLIFKQNFNSDLNRI